jgi:hypothetical protein
MPERALPSRHSPAKVTPDRRVAKTVVVEREGAPVRAGSPAQANFLRLSRVTSVLLTDSSGRSEDPFNHRTTGQKVEGVVYDYVGVGSVLITTPAGGTYTVTFRPRDGAVALELMRGESREAPDLAVRYNDLLPPEGATAMLRATPEGFEDVRLDTDGDGEFETFVEPSVAVAGPAARDVDGPTICFSTLRSGPNALVAIAAADSSGVRAIYYSLAAFLRDEAPFRLYDGPFEVEAGRNPVVTAFAEDGVGNRSVVNYTLKDQP